MPECYGGWEPHNSGCTTCLDLHFCREEAVKRLRAENARLQEKGAATCCAHGNLLLRVAEIRTQFAKIFPNGTASNHEAARKIAEILGEVE